MAGSAGGMDVGLDEEHDEPSWRRHGDTRAGELGQLFLGEALGRGRDPVDRLDRRRFAADAHLEVGGTEIGDRASRGVDDAHRHGREANLDLFAEDAAGARSRRFRPPRRRRVSDGAHGRWLGAVSPAPPASPCWGGPGLDGGGSVRDRLVAHDDARGFAVAPAPLRFEQRGRDVVAGGTVSIASSLISTLRISWVSGRPGAQVDRGRGRSEVDRPAAPPAAVERADDARRERLVEQAASGASGARRPPARRRAAPRPASRPGPLPRTRRHGRCRSCRRRGRSRRRRARAPTAPASRRRPATRLPGARGRSSQRPGPPRLEAESRLAGARGLDRDLARVGVGGQRLVGAAALIEQVEGAGSRRRREREEVISASETIASDRSWQTSQRPELPRKETTMRTHLESMDRRSGRTRAMRRSDRPRASWSADLERGAVRGAERSSATAYRPAPVRSNASARRRARRCACSTRSGWRRGSATPS